MYLLIRYGHGTKKCHPLSVQLAQLQMNNNILNCVIIN